MLLITDAGLSENNPNNPDQVAGTTFVGQFLDHDMTFDVGSRLGRATAPHAAVNARTPAFDLDSVYGAGPVASPQLYDRPTARSSGSRAEGCTRTCRAPPTARRSSPIPGTTSIS